MAEAEAIEGLSSEVPPQEVGVVIVEERQSSGKRSPENPSASSESESELLEDSKDEAVSVIKVRGGELPHLKDITPTMRPGDEHLELDEVTCLWWEAYSPLIALLHYLEGEKDQANEQTLRSLLRKAKVVATDSPYFDGLITEVYVVLEDLALNIPATTS